MEQDNYLNIHFHFFCSSINCSAQLLVSRTRCSVVLSVNLFWLLYKLFSRVVGFNDKMLNCSVCKLKIPHPFTPSIDTSCWQRGNLFPRQEFFKSLSLLSVLFGCSKLLAKVIGIFSSMPRSFFDSPRDA